MSSERGKGRPDKPSPEGPILTPNGRLQVLRAEESTFLLDSIGGLGLELATAGPIELIEHAEPDGVPGGLAAFRVGGRDQNVTVKYLTPTLSVLGNGLEVELVEEIPSELRPGVLFVTFWLWWWWPWLDECCECCCVDATLDPCQCELVVQKRRGWCLFDRPVKRRRGVFLWIYFGWPAEQVTSLTFCRTTCDPKTPIERHTEVQNHFDPPLPADFGDVRCQAFHPHRSIC